MKIVKDHYGSVIAPGAKVAFNYQGEVYSTNQVEVKDVSGAGDTFMDGLGIIGKNI